jgi:probable HAF family extracellular repeat protein
MTRLFSFSKLLFAAALTAPLAALAAPAYKIKVVGPAGSSAKGMNGYGQVVGTIQYGSTTRAFLYNGTSWANLGTLGGASSYAFGINDSGVVVGQADTSSGRSHAFSYWRGRMTDLGTLGGDSSTATSINNSGVIVGYANVAGGWAYAFRYQSGVMHNLGALPAGLGSYAYKINSKGVIAGASYEGPITFPEYPNYPVIYDGSTKKKISAYEGEANAINYYGKVVGGLNTWDLPLPHGRKAFLYDGSTMTFLGSLDSTIADSSAVGINNVGQVIGYSNVRLSETNWDYRPFIYTALGGMRNLNTLIDTSTGWEVISADAINDNRQIAGTGCKAGKCYAVRLDPVTP